MAAASTKFKVVVQKPSGGITYDLADSAYSIEREALDPIGAEIVEVPAKTEEEFIAAAKDADAVIARNRRITATIIKGLTHCKVIGLGSVGVDTVDVDAATEAGIVVTNVPDVFIDELADHTMAMFLAAHRRLRVIAYDPFLAELEMTAVGVEPVTSLIELCQRADFLSMHAPLNGETRHMMGEREFRAMKKSAIFINNGRGPTVDEKALSEALRQGWMAGAALDVFEVEPVDPSNPLLRMDNVLVTPHI